MSNISEPFFFFFFFENENFDIFHQRKLKLNYNQREAKETRNPKRDFNSLTNQTEEPAAEKEGPSQTKFEKFLQI